MSDPKPTFSDEDLVAYLDNEAPASLADAIKRSDDPALHARLNALGLPQDLTQAYALNRLAPPQAPRFAKHTAWHWPSAVAAAFLLGFAVNAAISRSTPDWVDAVASYQALYVAETLAGPVQDPAKTATVLAAAQSATGVDMRHALQVEGLAFKRAQLLAISGELLLQMAYLDADGVPFALCITRTGSGSAQAQTLMSHDLAAASWVEDDIGFVLIGGHDLARIDNMARDLRGAL